LRRRNSASIFGIAKTAPSLWKGCNFPFLTKPSPCSLSDPNIALASALFWHFVKLWGFFSGLYECMIALHSRAGTKAGLAGGVILAFGQMASEALSPSVRDRRPACGP
jgi:hypothetical protein